MKLINYTIAGTMFLAAGFAQADHHEKANKDTDKYAVKHLVKADNAIGAALWDHHGNQIGSISNLLIKPGEMGMVLAIVDVDWLDEDRSIAVPWAKIYVRTEEGDNDDIIYTLDVTKEDVAAAPAYDGNLNFSDEQCDQICRHWKMDTDAAAKHKDRTLERREVDTTRDVLDPVEPDELEPDEPEEN